MNFQQDAGGRIRSSYSTAPIRIDEVYTAGHELATCHVEEEEPREPLDEALEQREPEELDMRETKGKKRMSLKVLEGSEFSFRISSSCSSGLPRQEQRRMLGGSKLLHGVHS